MDALEGKLVTWAKKRADVRAAIVVGSRARTDHPADEWADLDVALATTKTEALPRRHELDRGDRPVWTMYQDPSGTTYHVLFEGGSMRESLSSDGAGEAGNARSAVAQRHPRSRAPCRSDWAKGCSASSTK